MSANKLINAVIAMVEDRTQDAREMLRSPEMRSIPLGEVHSRLSKSLRDRETKAQIAILKQVLGSSLHINATEATEHHSDLEPEELYLMGVVEMERVIDNAIAELESQILSRPRLEDSV